MQELVSTRSGQAFDPDIIDLAEISRTLWRRRAWVLGITGCGLAASILVSLSQPKLYAATTTLMPISTSSDRTPAPILGEFAPQGMTGTVSDKLAALLRSRSLSEQVIQKHDLLSQGYFAERDEPVSLSQAATKLAEALATTVDPLSGIIAISIEQPNPTAAADLANSYAEELQSYLQANTITAARRYRDFLEKRVSEASHELTAKEEALRQFQEQNMLVSLSDQRQATVQTYASLISQLMAKEGELKLLERSVSGNDVQLMGIKQEVNQIKRSLSDLEHGASGFLVSFKNLPKLGLKLSQLERELAVKQKAFDLAQEQLEVAKLDEAKDALSFQIIDRAIAPEIPSKPNRTTTIALGAIASFLLGVLIVLVTSRISRLRQHAESWS